MRTIAKLRLRKVVAGSLAIILVILGMFGYGVPVLANDDSGAYSVSQSSAGEPLTLGNQSRDAESGEYFYPDAVVDKDDVRSLIIAFKSSVAEGSKIILPENTANITL